MVLFNQGEQSAASNELENQLIEAQEDVFSKLDLVETAIDQRNAMLPDLFGVVSNESSDLSALNREIDNLQNKIDEVSGSAKFELEQKLDEKIGEAKLLVQKYGQPESVKRLMIQIEGAENRIAFEKKNYNDAVKSYNILVKKSKGAYPDYELESYYNAD
jgi:LemA protein